MKLPGFQMRGCHQQLDGRNLGSKCFNFLFAGSVRSQRLQGKEGVSKKKEVHPSGQSLGIVWEGVGTAGPHAASGRCRRLPRRRVPLFQSLLQHHPAMGSGGVQLPPAGQKFSGTEAGASGRVRLHAVFFTWIWGWQRALLPSGVGWLFFFSFLPFYMAALSAICCTKLSCRFRSGLLVVLAWLSWHISWWFVKSQNHRSGKVARDHAGSSDPTSLHQTILHQWVCPYLL